MRLNILYHQPFVYSQFFFIPLIWFVYSYGDIFLRFWMGYEYDPIVQSVLQIWVIIIFFEIVFQLIFSSLYIVYDKPQFLAFFNFFFTLILLFSTSIFIQNIGIVGVSFIILSIKLINILLLFLLIKK